jgi:hypothetical protein
MRFVLFSLGILLLAALVGFFLGYLLGMGS